MQKKSVIEYVLSSSSIAEINESLSLGHINEIFGMLDNKINEQVWEALLHIKDLLHENKSIKDLEEFYQTQISFLLKINDSAYLLKTYSEFTKTMLDTDKTRFTNAILMQTFEFLENVNCDKDLVINVYYLLIISYLDTFHKAIAANTCEKEPLFIFRSGTNYINEIAIEQMFADCQKSASEKKEMLDSINISISLFRINEYSLAGTYLEEITKVIKGCENDYARTFQAIIDYFMAKVNFKESRPFESCQEFFDSINQFIKIGNYEDALKSIIDWVYFLYMSDYKDISKHVTEKIEQIYHKTHTRNYAKFLFLKFNLNIENRKLALEIAHEIENLPIENLSADELYTIFIFMADYYSNFSTNFNNSLKYFELSNYYLKQHWAVLGRDLDYLKKYLDPQYYCRISQRFPDRLNDMIAEETVHFAHYTNSLKIAYKELENLYDKVKEMSLTDWLTNLHNRRYFWIQSHQLAMIANREFLPISFVIFDLDDFKKINDTYGHNEGDKALKVVAAVLKSSFRESDLIVRFGGEEFVVMLFNSDDFNAKKLCNDVLEKVKDTGIDTEDGRSYSVTASAGIFSSYIREPKNKDYINEMINKADKALYFSKSNGKNQATVYKAFME